MATQIHEQATNHLINAILPTTNAEDEEVAEAAVADAAVEEGEVEGEAVVEEAVSHHRTLESNMVKQELA